MLIGELKSLLLLWENLATNHRYQSYVTKMDITVFKRRVEHEGLDFLTTVLPKIGKALDEFHATTAWNEPSDFTSDPFFLVDTNDVDGKPLTFVLTEKEFMDRENEKDFISCSTMLREIRIPKFLGRAIRFALEGDSLAVDCVRQLTLAFYKLKVIHDESTVAEFLVNFRNIDEGLADLSDTEDSNTLLILRHMRSIIGRVLCNEDPYDIKPCHGSGATACRTANWDKYYKLDYYKKLDDVYPYSDLFFYSYTHLADEYKKLETSRVVDVPKARVVLVPKDSRGPRVISCEPSELMYVQQGLMRKLYGIVESHPMTAGHVNFSDQYVNRELARLSSIDGRCATLDLSDASDRVSLSLVREVFPSNWVRCLEACRSEVTILPDKSEVKLKKFAPMGSSCCFPVEALVFWACAEAVMHISRHGLKPLPRKWKYESQVFVYGDDIICPSALAGGVIEGLELIGLKVNRSKSFLSGPFRESCGGDYHKGYDVSPVRLRERFSSRGTGIIAAADFANSLIAKFGYDKCNSLIQVIEEAVEYVYPRTELDLPGSLRIPPCSSNDVFFARRFNKDRQRFEHRILGLSSVVLNKRLPSWEELLRKELQVLNDDTARDVYANRIANMEKHLLPGQYAVPHSARKNWGWAWLG